MLGPATRVLWRSPDTVHLELGSRAVVVEGLPPRLIAAVASPVGTAVGTADRIAADPSAAAALETLTENGYLWPRSSDPDDLRRTPPTPRLAGELAALATRHGDRASELLSARRHASVAVHGTGRAAAHLAAVLAAAGIGRVHCAVAGLARLLHAVPGGVEPADEGLDLASAADSAVHRAAPEVLTTPLPAGEVADLTVLAVDSPIADERRAALHAARAAHLPVLLGPDFGVIGPLVLPGLTSCLRCADLHRKDRDPAWSALAVQLGIERRHGPTSDVAVATLVAGAAAIQALAFLDGAESACTEGTLELRLPDWRLRRRSWPVHADCDCVARPESVG